MHPFFSEALVKERHDRLLAGAERRRLRPHPGARHHPIPRLADALAFLRRARLPRRSSTWRRVAVSPRALGTVMFTDIVASTETASALGDRRWREVLREHNRLVDGLVARFGGRRVKHTGDGVLCLFDLPGDALGCAEHLHDALDALSLRLRIGIHAGEIELLGDDITGVAVHVAARITGCAEAQETWTSSTVRDLILGGPFTLADQGTRALPGLGEWRLCRVETAEPRGYCAAAPCPTS